MSKQLAICLTKLSSSAVYITKPLSTPKPCPAHPPYLNAHCSKLELQYTVPLYRADKQGYSRAIEYNDASKCCFL